MLFKTLFCIRLLLLSRTFSLNSCVAGKQTVSLRVTFKHFSIMYHYQLEHTTQSIVKKQEAVRRCEK